MRIERHDQVHACADVALEGLEEMRIVWMVQGMALVELELKNMTLAVQEVFAGIEK
jgi:hypothetical protein